MTYKNLSSALLLLAVASCCDDLTCCEDNIVTTNYSVIAPVQLDESDRTVFFAAEGHGESDPIDPHHNKAAWSKNRRVITIFATQ